MDPRTGALISTICLVAALATVQWDVLLNLPTAVHDLMTADRLAHQALSEKDRGDALMRDASRAVSAAGSNPLAVLAAAPRIVRDVTEAYRHYERSLRLAEEGLRHLDRGLRLIGATSDPEIRRALDLMWEGLAGYRRALSEFHRGVVAARSGDFNAALRHVNASYRLMRRADQRFRQGRSMLEDKTLLFMGG